MPSSDHPDGSTPTTEGFVTVDGRRLHHRDIGHPSAPVTVLLHGIMGHCREWDVLVEALLPDNRIVVVDQRGHGHSDWADTYTGSALADDLIGVIEALALDHPAVIGHSMGGMAAMLAAARRPSLFERLLVIDVGPATVSGDMADGLRQFVQALGAASYGSVDDACGAWSGDPLAQPALLRHYVEHCLMTSPDGRLVWRFDGRGLTGFFDGIDEQELWDAVDHVDCPVLLVRGEHSPALSPATAAEMTRRFRDARLVVIPDGGHDLGVQQPEAVGAVARRFLSGEMP
jgi:pimeloyl-ACP methyl ester carboxylesterase